MKLIKYLSIILAILILITCASMIFAEDEEGSGSFISDDSSFDGGGNFESDDNPDEQYGSGGDEDIGKDIDSVSGENNVNLSKHPTSNPIALLLLVFSVMVGIYFKNKLE